MRKVFQYNKCLKWSLQFHEITDIWQSNKTVLFLRKNEKIWNRKNANLEGNHNMSKKIEELIEANIVMWLVKPPSMKLSSHMGTR